MRKTISWVIAWGLSIMVSAGSWAQGQRALVNTSRLASISSGVDVAANFTIEGSAPKPVLIRAVGPTLQLFGIPGSLGDPVLRVHDGTGVVVATNSAWGGTTALRAAFAAVGAFGINDSASKDAALLLTLAPGTYTAAVTSASGGSGSVLLEVYEMDATSRLAYLSMRDRVSSNNQPITTGFAVTGSSPATVLIRGLGPALTAAGVSGALANPMLTVFAGSTVIATNDNWGGATNLSEAAATAGLMPLAAGSADSALLLTLSPGNYTVHLAGAGGTGVAMVEVAQMDSSRAAAFAPALLVPPLDVRITAGSSATLAAPAVGRPTPTFQWRKSGNAIPGATNSSYTIASAQAADAANYTVAMTNSAGTTVSAVFVVSISSAATILTQPASQMVNVGQTATFTVVAGGSPAPSYQWFRNGVAVAGATQATLTLTDVQETSAGSYTVRVSNSLGTMTSNPATLTVVNPRLAIFTHPASQTVSSGDTVTFNVVASGDAPLRYQWLYNGAMIGGATNATLTHPLVLSSLAGSYSVTVSNTTGSLTSNPAVLTVRPRALEGVYLGTFPNGAQDAGTFALLVRADGTAAFLGSLHSTRQALVARDVRVGADRTFAFSAAALGGTGPAEYRLEGSITEDGRLVGTVTNISLSMNAPAPRTSSAGPASEGLYQGGAAGRPAITYAIVSAAAEVYVVTANGETAGAGRGLLGTGGTFDVSTAAGRITGSVQGPLMTFSLASGATATNFAAANNQARSEVEKLVNVSTRSHTGSGPDALIVGFVVTGEQPKLMLIRGIGPTLTNFGVANPLAAVRLEVFRGQTLVAHGEDWGAGASSVASAAARVNAFPLPADSRDAALLLPLPPGAYTAVVTGRNGATGVSLVEIYDASSGPIVPGERIVNVATRSTAGAGDRTLIAGFVVTGVVPKRVLIRGVGPSLAPFGVTGVLARPQLAVYADRTELARNAGWSQSADAAAIASAAQQAGAFALEPGSNDAALILNLAPGSYSAQVSGLGAETGAALVEVYELP